MISFVEKGDESPEDAIVVLKDPVLERGSVTYTVETLEGSLPAKGELVSVFIDPFGRPLSQAGDRDRHAALHKARALPVD